MRYKMKKAQGLSINVIIITVIALIVLVVLAAIFTGRIAIFGQRVGSIGNDCTNHWAEVDGSQDQAGWQIESCEADEKEIFTALDANEFPGEHCCVTFEAGARIITK